VPFRPFVPTAAFEAPGTPATAPPHRIVHGDNLEALKSLLPEFAGRVKCIYIDPPYNTGNEGWAYNDNVNDPRLLAWLHRTVGKEADDLSRHDKWLCMMYPRLQLLHKLLADDGAIFISIDDNEVAHLRCVMDEVFGSPNYVATIVWQKKYGPANDAKYLSETHEYIMCFAKSKPLWRPNLMPRDESQLTAYKNPDKDERGLWRASDLSAKTYSANTDYPITGPTGIVFTPPKSRAWIVSEARFQELLDDNRITFGSNGTGRPMQKKFLSEVRDGITVQTWWDRAFAGDNKIARYEMKEIFPENPFDTPKPSSLIERIIELATVKGGNSIILDSFAGSGTTLHAVAKLNARDGGRRQCLLVEVEAYADTLTAERARRVLGGYGTVPGLGGRFEYGELGAPLFEAATGLLSPLAPPAALRQYVWWQETGTRLPPPAPDAPACHPAYLGTTPDGARLYFDYDPAHPSTLDTAWLGRLAVRAPRYVVYADACEVAEDWLATHGVVYKKIPRDIGRL
jgi:adenine-specific DNA-methyltransferase